MRKTSGPNGFTGEFHETVKVNLNTNYFRK